MGRPFEQEIKTIAETYSFSKGIDVSSFERYIRSNLSNPFLVVGSGGSFSVALACSLLIESFGGFAKATTPYELLNAIYGLNHYNIIFLSASGNNVDIINAYRFCMRCEVNSSFILCLKESSKLIAEATEKYDDYKFLEVALPSGKDGFLAVNSTICSLGILETIYGRLKNIDTCSNIADALSNETIRCLNTSEIIALGGRWTMPVVSDFESKCIEAGLVNVMPADLRNFAHGRHHWIAKNPNTSVICLATADEVELAEKTIKLLPNDISKTIIASSRTGISATIELLTKVFLIVQKLGEKRGIDPGKPGVPSYGRKLYHLNYSLLSEPETIRMLPKDVLGRTVMRKLKAADLSADQYNEVRYHASVFLEKLSTAIFRGLVLDYDNTVIPHNDVSDTAFLSCINYIISFAEAGIYICFATGRGQSIRNQLITLIPEHLRDKIFISYHSGAEILPISNMPSSSTENIPQTLRFVSELISKELAFKGINQSLRNTCISLFGSARTLNRLYSFLSRKVLEEEITGITLAKSDHSVDVLLPSVSKVSAVSFMKEYCDGGNVLCIGDSGDELGNDYTMLSEEYSLSVGAVSTSMETCWNIASQGMSGPIATLEYFKKLQVLKSGLKFKSSYLKV